MSLLGRVEVGIPELSHGIELGGNVAAMVVFVMPTCDEVLGIINDVVTVKVVKFPKEDVVELNQRADEVFDELNIVVNVPFPMPVEFSHRGDDGPFAMVDVVWFAVPLPGCEVAVRTRVVSRVDVPDTKKVVSNDELAVGATTTLEGALKLDGADDRGSPTMEEGGNIEGGSV